ncbi:DNA repair protein-like protein rad5 [Alternaria rosae]|uniref:DNA repair protein-like protein rad5 n=1 Tax=Alternaria rosae TaxID=1187941 RepID=UPI001E8D8C79|nr:DNA repair protein-like protein rad5 [Alternaria rosae]KAH6882752.1 DNA repair protein-like protein rad5 [Alternaria rosae]
MVEPDGEDDMVDAQVPLSQVENMDHDQDAPVPSIEQVHDPDSLFIPEDDPSAQIITPQQEPVAPIATPPLPTLPRPKVTGQSVSQKIRAMQTIRDHQKLVTSRQTSAYQTNSNLDDEAYLEAVRPGQSSSAAVPAINEDDLADKKAIKDFEAKKRYYDEQKRKKGTLLFKEDVDWLKITGAEEARKKKRSRDLARQREEKDGQSDLFPEFNFTPNIEEEVESDHDFDIQDSGARKRRRPMPTKEGKNPSMQDAELQSMRVALEAEGDASRKKQKGAVASAEEQASVPSGRGKASKGKGPAKQKSGPKKQTRTRGGRYSAKKQEVDHAYKQATSLFNSDVFQQQAGASAADQPTFRSRNKTDALKELIASVPIEVQKKARLDIDILLAATKEFDGKGQVKADGSGLWRVRGMSTSLKPYQVLGTAFMRRRENATEEPRGGLMADQMGLGKTLMMLANIVNGRPPKSDTGPKTTLLIASPALLTQWKNEIELHTDASKVNIKIMRYGAGTRPDSTNADQILAGHDVVLTTYHEIMQSYPKNEPPIECQTAEQKIAWWKLVFEKQRGPLHRMMFLRVVLDEAQAIKNHMSRTSIACRALMAHHKWALSGTPILNSLTELYPYFKFLDVPHTGSFKIFKNNYCDSKNQENTERLLVRLSQFMIRRTHADEMFGAPILKLPQADQSTHWCEFNSVERSIYDIVRVRFAKCINMWAQNGTLDKAYSNVLVMLLRLRQLTGHILMLQFVIRDLLEREDIEAIKTVVDKEAQTSSERGGHTIIAVRKQLDKVAADQKRKTADLEARKATAKKAARTRKDAARKAAKEQGVNYVSEDDDVNANAIGKDDELLEEEFDEPIDEDPADDLIQRFTAGGGFGKDFNFKPFLSSLKTGESWEKTKQKAKCAWCGKQPRAPQITSCGHLICSEPCLENVVVEMAEADDPDVFPACKACGATPTHIHPCEVDEDDTPDAPARGTRANKKKNKEKQRARLDREEVSGEWLDLAGEDVLPSAKTIAVKSQIMNWLNENPHVKIIVYTQFLAMIRILDAVFRKEGWVAEKYHGKMSLSARDKAISSFAENPDCKIMLASLRCGGLGLNLTMASKVIMIDPWWNSASEQQAFCRVFRIGQREETIMSRLCVRNTVDETLIDMQDRKDKEIAAIMEDDGKTMKKMDTRTLMRLFGNLEEDPDGKPFIMVDNPNPRGGFRADRDDEGYADDF